MYLTFSWQIPALNSLPNDKFLNLTKFRAFADDKENVAKIMISVFDRVENIVGKGENAGHQHFFFFLLCFQKTSFSALRVVKSWNCEVES